MNISKQSIIELLYLIGMFCFYQTRQDYNMLAQGKFTSNSLVFKHLEGDIYGNRICLFGKIMLIPFSIFLLIRDNYTIKKVWTYLIIVISIILSFLNYNAFVYLIPVWIYELFNL